MKFTAVDGDGTTCEGEHQGNVPAVVELGMEAFPTLSR